MAKNRKKISIPYNYIWSKEKPISFITEAYQKFLANIEYVNVDKEYKVIHITSTLQREGKSTFLSNVAYLLSQKKYKVIVVDLDLRKPKVHEVFDVENIKGVTDILTGRVELNEAIKINKDLGFDVITSGERTSAVVNLIESNKMKELIEKLKNKYDYVLIDSPPVINVSDALYISKLADAVLFIIAQNQTKRKLVKEAVSMLRQNNVNIIGSVITQVDLKKNNYGYGYGYGYGYSYDYNYNDD